MLENVRNLAATLECQMCSLNVVRYYQCTMKCNFAQRLLNWMSGHMTLTSTVGNHFSVTRGPQMQNKRIGPDYL